MTERLQDVVAEFTKALNDISAARFLMVLGLRVKIDKTPELHRTVNPGNPDPLAYMVDGQPSDLPNNMSLAEWRRSEILANTVHGGLVDVLAGQQWLVLTYALWDEHFRERIAAAAYVNKNDVVSDVFGDLRHIRNDVVHNRGVAKTGIRSKSKLLKWFDSGDQIALTSEHYFEFRLALRNTFQIRGR